MTAEAWTNRNDLVIVADAGFVAFATVEREPGWATENFFLAVIPAGEHASIADAPLVHFQFAHFLGERRLALIFTGEAHLPDVRHPLAFRLAWLYRRQLGPVSFTPA